MNKFVKTTELFDCSNTYLKPLFENSVYPWDMLGKIGDYITELIKTGIPGYIEIKKGVLIGKRVKVYSNTTIEPPVIIGSDTEIRPGAFIRGNVIIGEGCVIGNSSELKNCIMLDNVQVPHDNYIGDSVLGNHSHMGAGAICSNLKADGKNIVIKGDENIDTGLRKIGGILADYADVGCGCVLNPGTVIGRRTSVYPLTALRGVIPPDCIVKSMDNIIKRI